MFPNGFLLKAPFMRNLVAGPMSSTRCQQCLEIGWCFSFEKWWSSPVIFLRHSRCTLMFWCVRPRTCFTLFSSGIERSLFYRFYLRKKIPKVVLGKLFEMFGQRLQVTYEIFCSHVVWVGTSVFLDQTRQINLHFGYQIKSNVFI